MPITAGCPESRRDRGARARAGRAERRRRARRRGRRGRTAPMQRRPPTTSTSAPGIAGAANRSPRITASATSPTSDRRPADISPSPRSHEPSSRHALSPSEDVPVSLGSSPMTTSTAAPARKPVTTAFERNWAIQPSLRTASSRNSTPVRSVIAATSCAACSPPRPGHEHRAAGDRGKRRARAGRDLPRRAEERVDERSRSRRVEAVLQRHAGDARVAEVLRHDQRRHRDPGGDVAAQPAAVVARQPLEDRDEAAHADDRLTLPRRTSALSRASASAREQPFGGAGREWGRGGVSCGTR